MREQEKVFFSRTSLTLELVSWLNTSSQSPQSLHLSLEETAECNQNWTAFKSVFSKINFHGQCRLHHFTQTTVFIPTISPVLLMMLHKQFASLTRVILMTAPRAELSATPNSPVCWLPAGLMGSFPLPLLLPLPLHFLRTGQSPFLAFTDSHDSLVNCAFKPFYFLSFWFGLYEQKNSSPLRACLHCALIAYAAVPLRNANGSCSRCSCSVCARENLCLLGLTV